jgi:poly-gamma-glutamate synthesis protein (capsule biosynthesis protein)
MKSQNKGDAWTLNPIVYKQIQDYAGKMNHIIMYLHAGLEGEYYPLAEWRQIYRSFIDCGADLVIASHPHVIQGREVYNGKNIYYSLGNLFFNNEEFLNSQIGRTSLVVECSIDSKKIHTTEHFLEFDSNSIHYASGVIKEQFKQLSDILSPENEEQYVKYYDDMVISCWNRYYKSYYSFPLFKYYNGKNWIVNIWNKLLRHLAQKVVEQPVSLNHIYHNINIDTHRFAVSRALQILSETY